MFLFATSIALFICMLWNFIDIKLLTLCSHQITIEIGTIIYEDRLKDSKSTYNVILKIHLQPFL